MAISSNKFVNVTSNILTETAVARDFSGLVISKGTPIDATKGLGKTYADGDIAVVTANTYANLFAENTAEYKWAANYFSYVSPSGTIPARAKFMKLQTVDNTDETPKDAFIRAIGKTETFGSFTFLSGSTTGVATSSLLKACATYNQGLNNDYRMVVDYSQTSGADNIYTNYVTKSGSTISGDLYDIKGLTLCDSCSYLTMARLAATDYTGTNTTGCDMFKTVSGVDATVTSDSVYDTLTELRLNFIGLVKEHGNQWNWYMRGFNMDGTDTAVYDNEMWFKSEIIKDLLTLEDTMEKIPANDTGIASVQMTIISSINMALKNGTILPGKPLSESKQQQVIQMTGSSDVLDTLNAKGYYLAVWMVADDEEYTIKYRIIYLKGDAVREISGQHVAA